jgi:hypothetical protein
MAVDDLLTQLSHIGSALGPIGVTVAGYLTRAVKRITTQAEDAKKVAEEAKKIATDTAAHFAEARNISKTFEDLRTSFRTEFSQFKTGIEERVSQASQEMRALVQKLVDEAERRNERNVERIVRGSRPEGYENDAILVELRSKLDHERDQRISMQETLTAHMRDGVERWLKMEKFIGRIEATIETWERDRAALEEQIESLRHEMLRPRPR